MSSGIYAALSGAITKMQAVEICSNNLSNVSSTGYKKDRLHFASVLDDATQTGQSQGINYAYVPTCKTDFTEGLMEPTHGDYDVAINGEGFFKIRSGNEISYTRLGNFDRASDGTLVTRSGEEVLTADNKPLTIPEGPISIDQYGAILSSEGEVGQLAVFALDQELLAKQGGAKFSYTGDPKSVIVQAADEVQFMQHNLERSNVKSMEETVILMTSMRAFESYQKAMKNYYTIDGKADEIGSL